MFYKLIKPKKTTKDVLMVNKCYLKKIPLKFFKSKPLAYIYQKSIFEKYNNEIEINQF